MQKSSNKTRVRNTVGNTKTKRQRLGNRLFNQNIDERPPEQLVDTKPRLFIIWALLIAAGLGLATNLYRLQMVDGVALKQKARSQQMVNLRPFIPRRQIVDRTNEVVLAVDRKVYTLYAHPKQFQKSNEVMAKKLAPILNQEADELEKKFNAKKSGILLSAALAEEIADQVVGLKSNGLELIQKYSRFYPQQDLTSEIIGYINSDRRGQAGVEISQEKFLERSPQSVRLSRSGNGMLMPDHAPEGFLHFDDLRIQVTIDTRLQRAAREALKQQVNKYGAKRGAVIVMDAWDGSLLAMVQSPNYNPNKYTKEDIPLFKNWAVGDLYEPGSTFKPLNVAIALENNIIRPEDIFNDSGYIKVADREFRNSQNKKYGNINIAQILQFSSNIGMVKIIQRMQPQQYYGWLEKLGLGEKSDTDLPFEVNSQLKSQQEFLGSPVEAATTSFGQGFSLTPLQLVQMTGALANGGRLVTPHVIKGLVDTKGQVHYTPTFPPPRQIFSPTTTQRVVEMMETVVNDKGTGKAAQIPGYRVAGKTGTSQKASQSGGYMVGKKITSFVGVLPVESPRYVIFAIVDEPKGENAYGGTVAAPIVKSVMEALINIERIPPSQGINPGINPGINQVYPR
jgi:cell division protein FtsI (penicillin-binding protein 3)